MACGCGRSPDGCRGWHSLTEEEFQMELEKYKKEREGDLKVIEVEHYTDRLFRFRLERPEDHKMKPGQFTMINVEGTPKRAYSFTNGPKDNFIEFYSIKVEGGALTSVLKCVEIGDPVKVSDKSTGSLLVENLTDGDNLYLLATGTGIAPFISILRDEETYKRFKSITVAWSVREKEELNAFDTFLKEANIRYIPIVTRDKEWQGENRRITTLIDEEVLMGDINPDTDRIMLCGNMDFNKDVKYMFDTNWTEASNRAKGTMAIEKAFVG
tara:strand:+ start:664 stop:1470 length:807 start_codon:yes stop_codon:yes gene_type:complete